MAVAFRVQVSEFTQYRIFLLAIPMAFRGQIS
jgi:hypothetical protein